MNNLPQKQETTADFFSLNLLIFWPVKLTFSLHFLSTVFLSGAERSVSYSVLYLDFGTFRTETPENHFLALRFSFKPTDKLSPKV